ncbi:tRNA-dihydrouridine synthase [Clostridia bacterium]|nr:tRNA-dihydrouridine synthase [Clostridia bacterium]
MILDQLQGSVLLAPMAGVTDRAYRDIAARFGAGMTCTEMVSAKGLYYHDKKTEILLDAGESPTAAQIFGHEPEIIAIAAPMAVAHGAVMLDINSGCPTPKITKNGDGAALARDPVRFGAVVRSAAKSVGVPVSVKIRSGWDDKSINAVEIAQVAEHSGAAMVTVHGRTAAQGYSGHADWDVIRRVVEAVRIPVVGNGDVTTAEGAVRMLAQTGCHAVMLGRGTLGNPWLIAQTAAALRGEAVPPNPTAEEKIALALRHVQTLIELKGEYIGIREARKHAMWYMKGLKGGARVRSLITAATSYDEMHDAITRGQ